MLKSVMNESEMQIYANEKEGYEVEFLYEYATRKLGYSASLILNEENKEEYIFKK